MYDSFRKQQNEFICTLRELIVSAKESIDLRSPFLKRLTVSGGCNGVAENRVLRIQGHNLLHLDVYLISISNLNRTGLFSTERGKRDLGN